MVGRTGRAGTHRPAGRIVGHWLRRTGAVVRADAVAYMRALAGRDNHVPMDLVSGNDATLLPLRQATVMF